MTILPQVDYISMKILPLVEHRWVRTNVNENIKPYHGKSVDKQREERNYSDSEILIGKCTKKVWIYGCK